ncbi:MAG: hypothetical protein EP348_09085, partial [Alphaproteobacteria bacterium]
MGVDARQLAATFFLVAALIVISAMLGRELEVVNIVVLSTMVVIAMGLGLWYLIFHGLRHTVSGNVDLLTDVIAASPEGRLLTTKDGRFVFSNGAFLRLFDLPSKGAGKTLRDIFTEDAGALEKIDALLKTAVYDGSTERRVDIRTGTGRWLSILAHSVDVLPDYIIWYV